MITSTMQTAFAALVVGAALTATAPVAFAAEMTVAETVKSAQSGIGRILARAVLRGADGQDRHFVSQGTGFLIDGSGDLVTNCHVLSIDPEPGSRQVGPTSVEVIFPDRPARHLRADVRGCDTLGDIAVVHVEGIEANRPALRFADADKVDIGEDVIAIGFAEGIPDLPSVTRGIVSGLHRSVNGGRFSDLVQTDASINHGNSGGPLLDLHGEVVAVNTYTPALSVKLTDVANATKAAAREPNGLIPVTTSGYNIYYSRDAATASRFTRQIIAEGRVHRPDFGVTVTTIGDLDLINLPMPGVLVTAVQPGSEADRKGLRKGDVVYAVEWADGRRAATPAEGSMNDALALIDRGQSVTFKIMRISQAGIEAIRNNEEVPAAEVKWMYAPLTATDHIDLSEVFQAFRMNWLATARDQPKRPG